MGVDIEVLKRQVAGEVITSSDAAFDSARRVWNAMIDRRPAIIVRPRHAGDVVSAVNFARERRLTLSSNNHRLRISIRRYRSLHKRVMRSKRPKVLAVIYLNLFCRKQKVSLSAKLTFQMEKKTASNLGRGAGEGLEINRKPSIRVCGWMPPFPGW